MLLSIRQIRKDRLARFLSPERCISRGMTLELYREQVLPCVREGLCAAVYTQVSDVEDETNGLLTYDRKKEKLAAAPMRLIASTLMDAVRE